MARPFQGQLLPPTLAASADGGVNLQNKWYAIHQVRLAFCFLRAHAIPGQSIELPLPLPGCFHGLG